MRRLLLRSKAGFVEVIVSHGNLRFSFLSLTRAGPGRLHVDTAPVCTYAVDMNLTLSLDAQTVSRARKRAEALGKSLNQLVREYLQQLAGADDAERSIAEFRRLSGRGHSRGWRFDRDEIHERS